MKNITTDVKRQSKENKNSTSQCDYTICYVKQIIKSHKYERKK